MARMPAPVSAARATIGGMLTVKDKMTLNFEARRWKFAGAKEATIRETFTESATLYYQRLNHLVDQVDAEAYAPQLVHRLRRQREKRVSARSSARRLGRAS
jgi:hypothetical protein